MTAARAAAATPLGELVVAIFGPTASGKSAVAERLAQRIPAVLVSADSMQVYRDVPILSNYPRTPTELVAIWDLDRRASVAEYARLAHTAIDRAIEGARTPIVVGGTGLYLRAALAELELPPAVAPAARMRIEEHYDREGAAAAHARLAAVDPRAAARVHPNDRRRVVRALELAETGRSLTPDNDRLWSPATRLPTLLVGLEVPLEVLEPAILERTRAMLERGAAEEAKRALARGPSPTAEKLLGLREAASLPFDEAIETISRRTRQYAAYQRKWMRRIPDLVPLDGTRPPDELADAILEVARARQRLPADRAG